MTSFDIERVDAIEMKRAMQTRLRYIIEMMMAS